MGITTDEEQGASSQEEVATGPLLPQEFLSTSLPMGFLRALGLPWLLPASAFHQAGFRLWLSHQSQGFRGPVGGACGVQDWVPTLTERLMAEQFGGSQNTTGSGSPDQA